MRRTSGPLLAVVTLLIAGCSQTPAVIELQPAGMELNRKGETRAIQATVKDSGGTPIADAAVEWTSSDPKVARVDGTGTVTAAASGTATVTARAGEANNRVIVTVAIPQSVTIEPPQVVMRSAGETATMFATVVDERGQTIPGMSVTWTSEDPAVATVAEGDVTAVADGLTRVVVQAGDVQGTAQVLVRGPQATRVIADRPTVVVKVGGSETISAQVIDDAEQPMPSAVLAWSTDDPSIASVNPAGVVTGVRRGDTVLRVQAGEVSTAVPVKVR